MCIKSQNSDFSLGAVVLSSTGTFKLNGGILETIAPVPPGLTDTDIQNRGWQTISVKTPASKYCRLCRPYKSLPTLVIIAPQSP